MDETGQQGMLYLCATPIGNLGDISPRVLETLSQADLIAAEDTRNSIKLLNHFDIHTPMTSYHEYNRTEKADELIAVMKSGRNVALITDAGTPAISDPGQVLVEKCHAAGIKVTSLPGPAACIVALSLSGLCTRRFVFEGFLPDNKKEMEEVLLKLSSEERTMILYAAPHDLRKILAKLSQTLGNRRMTVCRELTKRFEQILPTTLDEAVEYYSETEPRGEYVLVIEGKDPLLAKKEKEDSFSRMSIAEHVKMYEDEGMDKKEAMRAAAKDRGVSKREIYNALLNEQ